jgi:hypothetical protein
MADLYTNCAVDIRGQRLLEAADVSIERKSNAHEQLTLAKGRAGYSPGAPTMEIRITSGIRAAGFEYDAGPDILALNDVPFTIYAANSFLTSTGTILTDKGDKGVDKNANYEFTISAKFANWQRQ